MSNRLTELFQRKSKNILSVYVTAGFPELHSLVPICEALADEGVDLIEIGMPFSDPLADGPTIQRSSEVALKNGMDLREVLRQVKEVREKISLPLMLMGYLNPVIQYGPERFCQEAALAGADGLILPDLPLPEYQCWLAKPMEEAGLKSVFLITADTTDERILELDRATTGFIYAVSTPSITGGQNELAEEKLKHLARIPELGLSNKVIVGFGIHDRDTFQLACRHTAGAIIGSAFIRAVREGREANRAWEEVVAEFIQKIR